VHVARAALCACQRQRQRRLLPAPPQQLWGEGRPSSAERTAAHPIGCWLADVRVSEWPSDIGPFSHGRAHRRLEHKISLHKAASEVRDIVIVNNGITTKPHGISELGLAPHRQGHSAYY
jgi:hypothetical protein